MFVAVGDHAQSLNPAEIDRSFLMIVQYGVVAVFGDVSD